MITPTTIPTTIRMPATGAITASDTTMSRKNLPTACSYCWKPERLRSPSVGSFVGSGANWLFSHSVMRTVA